MKKLSLLLLTLCVSLAGWANESDPYRLNPFAYDLSSSWDEASQKLTLRFKVNSVPNLEDKNGWSCGIQVFAVDSRETKYYIWGTPGNTIREAHNGGAGTYEYVADLSSGRDLYGNLIPRNEDLTWMVRVAGRGDGNSTPVTPGNGEPVINYTLPRFWNFQNSFSDKRYISPSIAVSTNPNAPNFGDIFIIDNMNPSNHTDTKWSALSTGRGIYVYKPDFKTKAYSGKKVAIDPATKVGGFVDTSEPRDLCVSKDGRVFVCSYSTASTVAVWELKNNYTTWTPILNKEDITEKVTGGTTNKHSVVSMDVKGEGDDITLLLLCKGTTKNNNNKDFPLLKCVEYNVSTETLTEIQLPQQIYDFVYYNEGINAHARIAYDDTNNWIWCGFGTGSGENGGASYVRAFDPTIANDNNVNKNLKVNETIGNFWGGEAFCVKGNMLIKSIQLKTYYRPSIIFRTIDRSKTDVTAVITDDPCFTLDGDVNNPILDADFATDCYNDFALDYANNLYVANNWSGQVFPISLPYDGIKDTPAPSNQKFRLPLAVPNILATDLRYDIVRGKNQYEFSFNVNTKPEEAQIRFYESYEDMQESLNVVNADDFNGTNNNKPVYVYNIPADKLIQGRIAVTLGAVGGQADANGVITNDRLPAGVLYWSVYVKTRKSCVFAPIYRQEGTTIDTGNKDNKGNPIYDYERRHIVVNNYPETDMFGALIVAHNPSVTDDATRANRGLHIYGFNPEGNSNDEQGNINNNTRYSKRAEYLNQNADGRLHYPRRLVVGHDGKVYVADAGTATASRTTQGGVIHEHGGVKLWDPTNPNKFALFSDNKIGTATGVALYEHADGWKLYANNTYDEFSSHGDAYTPEAQDNPASYGWNGFVGYVLDKYTSGHNGSWSSWGNNATEVALRRGDASGNFAFAAMDKGLWICQYREHTVDIKTSIQQPLADNFEAYILSFVPYGANVRTWRSSEGIGVKSYDSNGNPVWDSNRSPYSQYEDSPLQSTPGGGVAYKKINGKEYVYVVNHDGNIAVLEITGWTGTGVSSKPTIPLANIKILTTPEFTKGDRTVDKTSTKWHTAFITSMCFDYAGNLVTTTGKGYQDAHQDILVYTMPYDRVNAREIQAPNSCRMIPERIAHVDMNKEDLDKLIEKHKIDHREGCAIDLYRPLQGGMFNTICLPFTLDLTALPEGHPLKDATLKEYTALRLNTVGGEKVLELVFSDAESIVANKPYIIQPPKDIPHIISFDGPLQLTSTTGGTIEKDVDGYSITHQGIVPFQYVEPKKDPNTGEILTLMLVSDNRLAAMTSAGNMLGFRGYFQLNQPLPKGMQTRITTSKGTTTNTTIVVDGKKVNVEKFLQEGRVYIRMGDSLYTITGEKVE